MKNKLQQHFPMIQDRNEILTTIFVQSNLSEIFNTWSTEQQNEFLDCCTGVKGIKLLYDSFFKEILNPESVPERMEELLSLILNRKVKILNVLPNDSTRIADESSLLIMDIVVELEDGSIANVEIQRIGYNFPGQRSACYSADLLLRQYKRVKGEQQKKFSYRNIKKVYTIILFEKSTHEFHQFPDIFIHHSKQKTDTGLQIELLQEYTFICLDIFKEIHQNKPVNTKLEAWLAFLCMDEPEKILELIERYSEFQTMYEEVYTMCQNVEKVMNMFSKELQELDRNTVQYMIDEMQDTINDQKNTITEQENTITEQENRITKQENALTKQESTITMQQGIIDATKKQLENVQLAYARELLKSGTDFSVISQSTGLSIDVIKKL